MKPLIILLSCGLFLILSAICAMAQSVQADYDRSFNLAKLKTYSFKEQMRPPEDPLAVSPLNDRRIHAVLDTQLQARGFSPSERPDFLIAYFVSARLGLNIDDNRISTLPWDRWGNITVNQVTEGTLIVMFVDTVTEQEIWVGVASAEINPKNLDRDLNKSITRLVQRFVKDQASKK
jgi:Domain of unknown function (DUF4136)